MYVITNHNEQNFVILGPVNWNPRYMSSMVSNEVDQEVTITQGMAQLLPLEIVPGIIIRQCNVVHEEINPKIEHHQGPIWTYNEDGTATCTFTRADKQVDIVKGELKSQVSLERYTKENSGLTVNIQGTNVFVSTDRTERNNFIQKYLLLGDAETIAWKFAETWLTLSKTDLGAIVSAINTHVQEAFDWELTKINSIDALTTLIELNEFVITEEITE